MQPSWVATFLVDPHQSSRAALISKQITGDKPGLYMQVSQMSPWELYSGITFWTKVCCTNSSRCIEEVFKAMLNPEHGFQEQQMSKIATWQAVPVEDVH